MTAFKSVNDYLRSDEGQYKFRQIQKLSAVPSKELRRPETLRLSSSSGSIRP